jgi:hypothetical protein
LSVEKAVKSLEGYGFSKPINNTGLLKKKRWGAHPTLQIIVSLWMKLFTKVTHAPGNNDEKFVNDEKLSECHFSIIKLKLGNY